MYTKSITDVSDQDGSSPCVTYTYVLCRKVLCTKHFTLAYLHISHNAYNIILTYF
jgi:hypothetical protein